MLQTHALKKREREMNFFSTDVNVNIFFFFPLRGPAVQYTTDYLCVRV